MSSGKPGARAFLSHASSTRLIIFGDHSRAPNRVCPSLKILIRIIEPMVPHLAEECWVLTENSHSLAHEPWPAINKSYLEFDEVTIAIATSEAKTPLFSLEERIDQIETIFKGNKNVRAIGFTGLVVDLAKEEDTNVLIRGLRAVSDFEYEFQLANMNRAMSPDLESVFLTPKAKFSFLSSTLVREIASMGGQLSAFVDPTVEEALKKRFKD